MEKRKLGRTELWVSVLGFGGAPIGEHLPLKSREEAENIVRYAFEEGVTYFDTARSYMNSEETLGAALEPVRDSCIIATKVGDRTKRGASVQLRQSLRKLRTNRIGLIQLHGVSSLDDLRKAMGPDGALEALKEARSQGLVDHIGLTGHYPHVLVEAIRTGEFDAVQAPINVITRQALEELVPTAKELDVGLIVMKPFGGQPFFPGSAEFRTLLGRDPYTVARRGLGFLLRQGVSTIIPGFESLMEVQAAVKAVEGFDPKAAEERFEFWDEEGGRYCRDGGTLHTCEMCLPCPEFVRVPAILRYDRYYGYGAKDWAQEQYRRLSTKVEDCTRCGECEKRCPYGLPIIELLERAARRLS
ncbi:MAG: aldo/keto reductase [Candidatus Bathyarchaeia archaeon]